MICKTCHTPLIDFMTRAKCPRCDRKEIEKGLRDEEDRYNRLTRLIYTGKSEMPSLLSRLIWFFTHLFKKDGK